MKGKRPNLFPRRIDLLFDKYYRMAKRKIKAGAPMISEPIATEPMIIEEIAFEGIKKTGKRR